ncbi:hypothetical protein ONE63_010407 [Megalurothrips usitatus]|uniref:Uncharacterized protein n=1 Tax=Megalurothrips usitatus TaxID=439358 RepID=A0AAV7XFW0_9NEOP|nr:hypothetical protein ONE63_010407 [Megalurothrips usitatus]
MSVLTVPAALPALVFAAVLAAASGTLWEGSPCFHEASQTRGVCKLLPYCSWAVKERRSELYPQTCSFVGYLPVVCCPYTRTHDPPHLPLRPARPGVLAPDGPPVGPDGADVFIAPMSGKPAEPGPQDLEYAGPLGPLQPTPGPEVHQSLQQELDRRISGEGEDAGAGSVGSGLPPHLQFGDGSGLAFLAARG